MANIKNTYGISSIHLEKELTLYCPMGEADYQAKVTVNIFPADEIMDYCETDAFLTSLNGQPLIIEELASKVHDHIVEAIDPHHVKVQVDVSEAAHMPVTVIKTGARDDG